MGKSFDFASALMEELTKYSDEVKKETRTILKEEADNLVNTLKSTSPNATGKYAKGWTVKKNYENNLNVSYTVYQKNKPQLSHLLEFGYATRSGGRVAGRSHIAPAEETAKETIVRRIEEAVRR